jgi:hypothetical protein
MIQRFRVDRKTIAKANEKARLSSMILSPCLERWMNEGHRYTKISKIPIRVKWNAMLIRVTTF